MTEEGRYQRTVRRAEATNWENRRLSRQSRGYLRWLESIRNLKVYDKHGFPYWAYDRPQLFHKGRKP